MEFIQSWLQLIGLSLDLLGFCYLLFDGWLSHAKTYNSKERQFLEKTQFENPKARAVLSKPIIKTEDAIVWRRKSFMSGCSFIIIGFIFQIVSVLISGTFVLSK